MQGLPAPVAHRLNALMDSERAVAWLQIDPDLTVIDAGGQLDHYGLAEIRRGEPVEEQVVFLEGLLPLFESPYILPSVGLATDVAADVHFHIDANATWVVLLDVTAERDVMRRVQQKA